MSKVSTRVSCFSMLCTLRPKGEKSYFTPQMKTGKKQPSAPESPKDLWTRNLWKHCCHWKMLQNTEQFLTVSIKIVIQSFYVVCLVHHPELREMSGF